jgi:catechol 2,3-dioxygenase-like lactoylglutathione lyase family enzyme
MVGARLGRLCNSIATTQEMIMFANTKAFSGFAVEDVERAREFYGGTLGIRTSEEHGLMTLHIAGERPTIVYPKTGHTPAEYTILNFPVEDIDEAVAQLAARGVHFERYDGFEQDEQGVFRGGGPLIAWFKDPSGNILSVLQQD